MTTSPAGDPSFDRYARMVRRALTVPVALVTLVEDERQHFTGAEGLPEELERTRETPLSHSICHFVVADEQPLVVPDTSIDDLLATHPAVRDLAIRAYAGWPITDHRGTTIGSLCALDYEAHDWTAEELASLEDLAAACSAELAQRGLREEAASSELAAQALTARSQALLALSQELVTANSVTEVALAVERAAVQQLRCLRAGLWLDGAWVSSSRSLPGGASAPGELVLVAITEQGWAEAAAHSVVRREQHHPVASAAHGTALYYESAVQQQADFPEVGTTSAAGKARAFLPLRAGRDVVGTLVLTWPEARTFGEEDQRTMRALASNAAQAASRSMLVEGRLDASRTLQHAMLTDLPQPDDLELAARYHPASSLEEVGGDWYDAVLLPSGCTAIAVGDVVGHDIAAAAHMSQLRSLLRGLAWASDESPALTVARLDRALPGLGMTALASLVYARIEQTAEQREQGVRMVRWTNAGHPPPLLVSADGTTSWVTSSDTEPMLGVAPDRFRHDHALAVDDGSTLILYTDGLVERRGEHLDDGLHRLRATAERHHADGLDSLMDELLAPVVGDHLSDDVAVLAVRFHRQSRGVEPDVS